MSFSTLVMAAVALAGLLCLVAFTLVGLALTAFPFLVWRQKSQPKARRSRQPAPRPQRAQTQPVVVVAPAPAPDPRPENDHALADVRLYAAGLLH